MTWVIAYDVSKDLKRTRISKVLVQHGIRIQKSVFLVEASRRSIQQLINELAQHVDPVTDRICAWPLSQTWKSEQQSAPSDAGLLEEVFIVG